MHPIRTALAVLGAFLLLVVVAGGILGSTLTSQGGGVMPEVIGMRLDEAHDALKKINVRTFDDVDAFGSRAVLRDSNWVVVEQQPAPGTTLKADQTIRLAVGKSDEANTAAALGRGPDSSASASASKAVPPTSASVPPSTSAPAATTTTEQPSPVATSPAPTPSPTSSDQAAIAECTSRAPANGEIYERNITTDEPPTVLALGGGWVWDFGDRKCITSIELALSTNPPLPGFCTQVALIADNPGYDPDVVPAPPLKNVLAVSGDC